tara:strand:- start:545 stop:865 length:321 start_codon:yes stop_codon:yes gene_type:complete
MKENFHVMTLKGVHDYDIIVTETDSGNKFELFYSLHNEWTKPGKLVMAIKEKDQDSSIDLPKLGRNVDISTVNELSILLKFALLYEQEQFMDDLRYNIVPAKGYTV